MAHLLFSQEQDQPIKWFEKFDKEEIKTEIKKWLIENTTDTLEHCRVYSLKGFQETFNDQKDEVGHSEDFIRFINVIKFD